MKYKFEFRTFMDFDPVNVRSALEADGLSKVVQQESDLYLVSQTNTTARLRGSQVKVKGPESTDGLVDKMRDDRHYLPVSSAVLDDAFGVSTKPRQVKTTDDLQGYAALHSVVEKDMTKYTGDGLEVEVSKVKIGNQTKHTVCVASDDPDKIKEAIAKYGVQGMKMNYAQAVRAFAK